MKILKHRIAHILFIGSIFLISCSEDELSIEEQFIEDTSIIEQYILDNDIQNVEKTSSGLYYVIQTPGTGSNAGVGSNVTVHYDGILLDGDKFDSSVDRQLPFNFTIGEGRVIPGWDEGLQFFSEGAKGLLLLPSSLAYGRQGNGSIGPNTVLIFEVELLVINLSVGEQLAADISIIEQYILDQNLQNVEKTASGLHYVVQTEGTGSNATVGSTVTVHYDGTFIDGVKFDSSIDRGASFAFTVGTNQVIAGWDEGLQFFNQGAKGLIMLPSSLAYGRTGIGDIPPNTVTIFEVELLTIK